MLKFKSQFISTSVPCREMLKTLFFKPVGQKSRVPWKETSCLILSTRNGMWEKSMVRMFSQLCSLFLTPLVFESLLSAHLLWYTIKFGYSKLPEKQYPFKPFFPQYFEHLFRRLTCDIIPKYHGKSIGKFRGVVYLFLFGLPWAALF